MPAPSGKHRGAIPRGMPPHPHERPAGHSDDRPSKSSMPDIKTVGVLGGGLMGSGIAQVAAQAGFRTIVREVSEALAAKARASIEKSLAKGIEKGKVTPEERDAALARIRTTTDVGALGECDLVIEAVVEDLEVKNVLWRELDGIAPAHAIFASNTSSLTIAAMAAESRRPDRMIGL